MISKAITKKIPWLTSENPVVKFIKLKVTFFKPRKPTAKNYENFDNLHRLPSCGKIWSGVSLFNLPFFGAGRRFEPKKLGEYSRLG
jgi:hypothetical protein